MSDRHINKKGVKYLTTESYNEGRQSVLAELENEIEERIMLFIGSKEAINKGIIAAYKTVISIIRSKKGGAL
jgi:hypothetical protein